MPLGCEGQARPRQQSEQQREDRRVDELSMHDGVIPPKWDVGTGYGLLWKVRSGGFKRDETGVKQGSREAPGTRPLPPPAVPLLDIAPKTGRIQRP